MQRVTWVLSIQQMSAVLVLLNLLSGPCRGKIDAESYSDRRYKLLFAGQIAFATKMSSVVRWEMRCSDLQG